MISENTFWWGVLIIFIIVFSIIIKKIIDETKYLSPKE